MEPDSLLTENDRSIFSRFSHGSGAADLTVALADELSRVTDDFDVARATVANIKNAGLDDICLDLVIHYVLESLEDHHLSDHEGAVVAMLKHLCKIEEGAFRHRRTPEVASVLCAEVEQMLADGSVNSLEDLELVELQRAFDLSFDEFLVMTRPLVKEALHRLDYEQGSAASYSRHKLKQDWILRSSE